MSKSRRRAIHAHLIRESKDNPGYYRYNITIQEKDGRIHDVPAYGKDLQDAIERLIWTERYNNISRKRSTSNIILFSMLSIVVLSGVLSYEHNNSVWIFGAIGINLLFGLISKYIETYLQK